MISAKPKLMQLTTVDLSLRVLLAHQLHRFTEAGYEVIGASAPGPYVKELEAEGIRHVPVQHLTRNWSPTRDARALLELVRLFRKERPDIVHTHNPKSGVLGRLAARIARVPVIVNTVHGLYANPALPPFKRFVVSQSERWAMRMSHHEFFQSSEDYRLAVRTKMVRASRASILGNGVDLRRFDPGEVDPEAVAELRRSWGVLDATAVGDEAAIVVGTVGRLVREKGYLELFAAAREARRRNRRLTFVAVGPEEPTKDDGLSSQDLAQARADGVVVAGEGRTEDMPATYAAFDIFVLPSYREGMPRSAIEASAMRVPVIATDIRGCREVVDDGVSGTLIPPRNADAITEAVEALAVDPARRQDFGDAGRTRALGLFDEELVIAKVLTVYKALLATHGRRARAPRGGRA